MCLAVPMRLAEFLSPETGVAELDGIRCEVDLSLVDGPQVGDHLIVHTGFAIEKLDCIEAERRLELFKTFEKTRRKTARSRRSTP